MRRFTVDVTGQRNDGRLALRLHYAHHGAAIGGATGMLSP
jgi:hypothetical protein